MTNTRVIAFAACVLSLCLRSAGQPVTFDSKQTLVNAVAFLDDDTVVVARCALVTSKDRGLQTWAIEGAQFRLVAANPHFSRVLTLHRTHGGILVSMLPLASKGVLVSSDLKTIVPILFDESCVSISGDTIGWSSGNANWRIWRIHPGNQQLREGPQILESVSDVGFVVQDKNAKFHAETFDGKHRLAFKGYEAYVLDSERVFVDRRLLDFAGRTVRKLPVPAGWGLTKWNEAATRVVFDHYSSKPTSLEERLLPFGDEPSNVRAIRVVDVESGNVCFDSKQTKAQYTIEPMQSRADISPSGRRIAIITDGALKIEALPENCALGK